MRIAVVLLLCLAIPRMPRAAAQSANPSKVAGGPYVVNAGPRSATVMWLVETGPGVLHAEKTVLTDLQPGKKYDYQAFPGNAGKGSFKTPPADAAAFEFVMYGDTRTRHDVHRSVIDAVLKYAHPDFVMHVGDLVAEATDNSLWPLFFDAEGELLRQAVIYPALGNHEHNDQRYYDYMDARPYYSFDWGNAHFTVINSDIGNAGATAADRDAFWREQTNWLEQDLENSQKAGFRFVFAHHPPMTAVRRRQGQNAHMIALEPMWEKYKVTAGFFGHDHNYQHYLKNGIHYFICGGGGAPLYDVDTPPAGITQKVESTENFVDVKVDGKQARVTAIKPNGEVVDVADLRP
jgi:calcineurin-like phosphoesterase family protein